MPSLVSNIFSSAFSLYFNRHLFPYCPSYFARSVGGKSVLDFHSAIQLNHATWDLLPSTIWNMMVLTKSSLATSVVAPAVQTSQRSTSRNHTWPS